MKKITVAFISLLFCLTGMGQYRINVLVKDSTTGEPLPNVSIINKGAEPGHITDKEGRSTFIIINPILTLTSTGYRTRDFVISLPLKDSLYIFLLEREEKELGEVIVSSSRTESRIENLATKVEVLGAEEVEEESGLKPGNIASLLGDIAGIQTQQTSAATGNTELRVQGLPGKYTQLLKDGIPLFAGYSGGFSILQIPPLDLKQIEIVKGASSTLYGGGAIAGMINLVSKRPKEGVFEKTILLNGTSLRETNINVYVSNRKKKIGYTFFAGLNRQQQVDVNKDGFSDLPDTKGYFIHPVLFFYPDESNLVSLGYNAVFEKRKGGDMEVLKGNKNTQHQYFVSNKSMRNSLELTWENKINTKDRLDFKGTGSWLNRDIETNVFGMRARQISWYTELSYLKRFSKHDLVGGLNFLGEHFRKKLPDSSSIPDYTNNTTGIFVQDDWHVTKILTVQSGLRWDHHNIYSDFILPRISLMYKFNPWFTGRIGGGLGYKVPDFFTSELDEKDLHDFLPNYISLAAERSQGASLDVNYHRLVSGWDLTVNQTFYITNIDHPLTLDTTLYGKFYLRNQSFPVTTHGFETYIQVQKNEFEIYLGYTYTIAKKSYDLVYPFVSLSARNKFATVLAYEFTDYFRAGVEAAFTGRQYLDNGSSTPAYPFVAAMVRFDAGIFSFVLNCENLLDYRQSKKETIVDPPFTNPTFKQIWAPLDGRAVNLSIRLKW